MKTLRNVGPTSPYGRTRVKRCRHGQTICPVCIEITDVAKRMSDIINALITFTPLWELRSKWIAIRLQDGGYDGTLYDSRDDAIRHQIDERFCCYVYMANMINGSKPLDCAIYLEFQRQAYDAGMRLHEPEAPQLIMPTGLYDRMTGRQRFGGLSRVKRVRQVGRECRAD